MKISILPFLSISIIITVITACTSSKISVKTKPEVISNSVDLIDDIGFKSWSHKDLKTDNIPGISLDKAYEFLKNKKGKKVIVGVIDSGVDIEHEDLKDVIWVNKKEIPNNNIDDDKNGFVDDINGWNFLGSDKGNSYLEQLEMTRIVSNMHDRFKDKEYKDIPLGDIADFNEYSKLKDEVLTKQVRNQVSFDLQREKLEDVEKYKKIISKVLNVDNFSVFDLKKLKSNDYDIVKASKVLNTLLELDSQLDIESLEKHIHRVMEYYGSKHYVLNFNGRAIVGDNVYDIEDKNYGNNDVIGFKDKESHGTHVAGIISATRNNGKGIDGIADNVEIMTVRAVPDGDEYDKDVALAIRYAVDNGAKVINMSFGKSHSPNKQWVFDAIKYAEKHDVILVNAAGNSALNIDIEHTYPNDSKDLTNEISNNFITVGATSIDYNKNLLAVFTNYGKKNVDVFAPGVEIYSTTPRDNYQFFSGTSMAAPTVAGVASLIRSYYPSLSAKQVKHILMNSGTDVDIKVALPFKSSEIPNNELITDTNLSSISVSGKIVNAYNALVMADKMASKN
ncbi:S8 family peptidase [Ichthyobacterium seriolicida]|uniref:Peptidase S8 n=1 Tax=Ichthyobacterium seriolicida TaxID=242600 RepID=A0A1J1E6N4_9FLAO|nr:S8 family peptidase [Ichthyobacterium seriolicida]BAV94998.1 peptidase S8 [Ichthyobacterium seriolicida]